MRDLPDRVIRILNVRTSCLQSLLSSSIRLTRIDFAQQYLDETQALPYIVVEFACDRFPLLLL